MTHYEIGHKTETGTRFIFTTSSLLELLKKWVEQNYSTEQGYFMDIWLMDSRGINHPIAELKPENIDFKTLKELLC